MPVTEHRGPVHDYLGMIFDFSTGKEVQITMYQYIDSVLEDVPTVYKEGISTVTPAPLNLYETRAEGVEMLNNKEKDQYHSTTVQLLYL